MENYRLLERLGKGGQGSVYLAENKVDNTKYVIKKIECFDESEANKAFQEALVLKTLCHPNICGYKEFFVNWDKQESSMFVCIVMDYYSKGDLRGIIKDYQDNKKPIPEKQIKKYFWEIVEALRFVHGKGVVHRDIKPSNIFIKDDETVCLGDFGVSTLMSDRRTCSRNAEGTTVYMAPEVMTQAFDERSDVWSLGCLLFEMLTTSLSSQNEVAQKLTEAKKDVQSLEEIYEEICTIYSGKWIKTIRHMLKIPRETRPNIASLMKMGFVLDCAMVADSPLLDKQRRRRQTVNRIRPLPDTDSADSIVCYIADTIDHEECVLAGLEVLSDMLQANVAAQEKGGPPQPRIFLDQRSKNLISLAMWDNQANCEVQIAGFAVLTALVNDADSSDVLFTPEPISIINKVMKLHHANPEVQRAAASLMLALSTHNEASKTIGQLGGIKDLVTAMKNYLHDTSVITTCCNALWSLTLNEKNAEMAAEQNAMQQVCLALKTHLQSPEVVEAVTAAMVSLSLDDRCFSSVNELDAVGSLLEAMDLHLKNTKIIKNACMTLAALVEPNEECAYRMLTSDDLQDKRLTGIPVLIKAYQLHRDNPDIVEAIITVIMELCEYEDAVALMQHTDVELALLETHRHYKQNRDIVTPCEAALEKLGISKTLTSRQNSVQTK
ncbi:serine/threonine kinase-like domain-containing protein STKLD1 isoform X2 [Pomacea canaliculata]|uniref:serine/threonine kinase-like domain-containing protein STKLD1 isoform X2 n=1 Tax=Pomacea canaliculata TaxID=400727 RepID=UPI000D7306FE|nr:serine/threonine kinase-like domain-containing protein STKLD1 isoform X2 [Pomacea canaliculata]